MSAHDMGAPTTTSPAPDRTDALAERLVGATLGALELFSVYLDAEPGAAAAETRSYRPAVTHELPADWLAAMPDVVARLEGPRRARVADVGCGQGWSALAIADAFLDVAVEGLDLDAASIADARRHAADAGVSGRVRFREGYASDLAGHGPYDLILLLEALHDMAVPLDGLRAARAAVAPGGAVLIVDERVADAFTAPGDEVERMMFGWSVTHCLPTQMVAQPTAALGTALRADTVRALAAEAGFARAEVLPVHNDFFRLYRLDP